MVRLIRQSKQPTPDPDDRIWSLLPSALWDLDFSGPLAWIESQGCEDADEFKRLVRNDPRALDECLDRIGIDRVSAGAVSLVGAASAQECIRRSAELLTAESKADFLRVLMAAFRGEHDVHLETAIVTCAREPRDVRVHWRFVPDDEQRFERALVSVVDMTAERDLQQRLLLAERMSAIGTLTASIIHEIKNPLTFVWNHLRSLRDSTDLASADRAELVREAFEGAERIRIISNEIASLSHPASSGEVETVHVKQALDSAIRLAEPEIQHRARVVREYEDGSLYVRGSRTRVGQVFVNLIVNAAQAIDPGDRERNTITIRVRSTERDRVCVEVQDTGPGIPPQLLRRIFDPFVTTKPAGRGTGLGLSICKHLACLMGGDVGMESEPGRGSRFHFTVSFPRGDAAAVTALAGGNEQPASTGRRLRVLAAEDNELNQVVLRSLVAMVDADLDLVSNGRDAVEAAARNDYDVILMDGNMPGIDGRTATRLIRALDGPAGQVPIIALTADALGGDREKYIASGMNDYVEKPINPTALFEAIGRCTGVYYDVWSDKDATAAAGSDKAGAA